MSIIIPTTGSMDITNCCNLKCLHCFNKSNELARDELSDKEVMEIMRDVAKLKLYNFCFCGGETLLRYDLIVKCTEILKKTGTYNINIVTNGILLTEKKLTALKEAGISMVQISIDGSCEKTHNRMRQSNNAFAGAINAIHLLEQNHLQFSVAFCPTIFNINEFPELARMLDKYEYMTSLRVQPLMVMGRATKDIEPTHIQYRNLVTNINSFKIGNKLHYSIEWGDPIDHLIRFRDYVHNIGLINILSNGDLSVSPYLPLVIGSLRNHSLLTYINSGLCSAWKSKIVRDYAEDIRCIDDLGKPHFGRTIFKDDSKIMDLIDNKEVFFND